MSIPLLEDHQIRQIVSNKLQHEDFHIEKYILGPVESKVSIMAELFNLKCIVAAKNLNRKCTHLFFVKMARGVCSIYNDDTARKVFRKEKHVFDAFLKMNIQCINNAIPTCYYTDDHYVVLSDLLAEGFTILKDQAYASDQEMRAILKSLACIHAGGIIYEEQQRQATGDHAFTLQDAFPEAFTEIYLSLCNQDYYTATFKGIISALDIFEMPKTLINGKRFADEVQTLWRVLETVPSKTYRNTICHNDLWNANIFVKSNGGQDGDTSAKIIDFQIVRYLPPAADVLLTIFLNTSREHRQDHFKSLLSYYFAQFTDCLRNNATDPDRIYTYEEFLESVREMEFYANVLNCVITPLVSVTSEEMAELTPDERTFVLIEDRSVLLHKFKHNQYYMKRVKDVVLQLKDLFERS